MSQAPLPAWRRLFAAGGGPAVSHAALSRAPAPERLMDPMAQVRLAHEASLDALARPLDLSGVLARVAGAIDATDVTPPDPEAGSTRSAPARRGVATAGSEPARARLEAHARPEVPGDAGGAPAVRGGPERLRTAAPKPPAARPRAGGAGAALEIPRGHLGPVAPATVAVSASAVAGRPNLPPEARVGANARVRLNTPVAEVERLLAVGAPVAVEFPRARGKALPDSPATARAGPDPARLLAGAVERVNHRRGSAPTTALPVDPRSPTQRRGIDSPVRASRLYLDADAVADDAPPPGGFRGLARRTLGAPDGGRPIPMRLEPEARIASAVPLDDLDSRVGESLARVLEREVRRYGIDLAESRP